MEKKFDVYYVVDTARLKTRYLDANGISHDKPKAMTYETARRVVQKYMHSELVNWVLVEKPRIE